MLAIPAGNHALHRRVNVLGRRYFTGRFSGVHDWPVLGVHRGYNLWPFQDLVETHRKTGAVIAPNANKVLRDPAGHAATLGLSELAEVFRDAFDPDIRNAYAHADYIIWNDGLRLRKRNGGFPRKVPWSEFQSRFDRGINLFRLLREMVNEYVASYHPAKRLRARMDDNQPELLWTIHFDPETRTFGISGGLG